MSNNGSSAASGDNRAGGSNRRRRNYRHFGPSGSGSASEPTVTSGEGQPVQIQRNNRSEERNGATPARERRVYADTPETRNDPGSRQRSQTPAQPGSGQPRDNAGQNRSRRNRSQSGAANQVRQTPPGGPSPQRPTEARHPEQMTARAGEVPVKPTEPSVKAQEMPRQPQQQQNQQQNNRKSNQPRDNQERANRPEPAARPVQLANPDRQSRWDRRIKAEETLEEIKRDLERIEKEIWLEIAGLHTIKLDY